MNLAIRAFSLLLLVGVVISDTAEACRLFRGRCRVRVFRKCNPCYVPHTQTHQQEFSSPGREVIPTPDAEEDNVASPSDRPVTPRTVQPRTRLRQNQSRILNLPESELSKEQLELKKYMAGDKELENLLIKWKAQEPLLSVNQLALAFAVHEIQGKSIEGRYDPRLCREAKSFSWYMRNRQSQYSSRGYKHSGFNGRWSRLRYHNKRLSEISGESWPDSGDSLMKHARACVKRMMQNSNYRRRMTTYHDRFCYAMYKGQNNVFYCTGLFGNSR